MIALLFHFLTGHLLHATRGLYRAGAVICWGVNFAVFAGIFLARGAKGWGRPGGRLPALVAVLGTFDAGLLLFAAPMVSYERVGKWGPLLSLTLLAVLAGGTLALWRELSRRGASLRFGVVGAAAAALALLAARVCVLFVSPQPFIDVFVFNSMACDALWSGHDPYSITYPDIYHGAFAFPAVLPYPPGYVLWALPFRIGLADVRFAQVFADIVSSAALLFIARKSGLKPWISALLALAWLASPVSLFVTEQAFVDPVVAAWAGLFFLALVYRKWLLAGAALGFLCTIKQYGFVVGLGALPWLAFQLPRRDLFRLLGIAAVLSAAIVVPFAMADWPSFFRSVVASHASVGVRADGFTALAFLLNELHLKVPTAVPAGVTVLTLLGGLVWLWRRRGGHLADAAGYVVLSYGVAFFLGTQAFCAYYDLLDYFVLLALALNGGRFTPRSPSAPLHEGALHPA